MERDCRGNRSKCVQRLSTLYSRSSGSLRMQFRPNTQVSALYTKQSWLPKYLMYIHIPPQWPSHTEFNTLQSYYSSILQPHMQNINCGKEVLNPVPPWRQGCHCSWVQPIARLSIYSWKAQSQTHLWHKHIHTANCTVKHSAQTAWMAPACSPLQQFRAKVC